MTTEEGRRLANRLVATMFFVAILAACGPDHAKRFDNAGTVLPNFRFVVELESAANREELFAVIREVAKTEGYRKSMGKPFIAGLSAASPEERINEAFEWQQQNDSADMHRIQFSWYAEGGQGTVPSFRLIVYSKSLDAFNADQWRSFARWRDEILPTAFPNSTINVILHPVEFTAPEDLDAISRETGIPVPTAAGDQHGQE